jgi:hypothetical protein
LPLLCGCFANNTKGCSPYGERKQGVLKMKKNVFVSIIITAMALTLSCKEEITKPITPIEPPKVIEPGRRDYVWDETIVQATRSKVYFRSVWGSSPADIWATAHADTISATLWHYDGTVWKGWPIPTNIPDLNRLGYATHVWGIKQNDVWVINFWGEIFRFDGKEWKLYTKLLVEGHDYFRCQRMWGKGDSEIYAVGNCYNYNDFPDSEGYGVIFKYNGKEWKQLTIPKVYEIFGFVRKDKADILYILGWGYNTGIDKVYSYDGVNFKEVMTSPYEISLGDNTSDVLAITNRKSYKLFNSAKVEWLDFKDNDFTYQIFAGRNEKDIFGNANSVQHYNGTNIQILHSLSGSRILVSILLFEKDAFFFIENNSSKNTKVLHGKLN